MQDSLPDRYEIQAQLGSSQHNRVYRVVDRMLGESVVLKVFGYLHEDEERAAFTRDIRLVRRITHSNVCRVFDVVHEDDLTFVTMEWVDGADLERLGRIDEPEALRIVTGVAAGPAAAHARGIAHGSISPRNILVAKDGRVVVTDFLVGSGSSRHAAPEGRSPDLFGPPSDVFSLGVVLYELVSGIEAIAREAYDSDVITPPHEHERVLRRELAELIKRMLAGTPDRRPTAVSAAQRLRHLQAQAATITRDAPLDVLPEGHGPRLAILDFRYHGPASHAHLKGAFATQLVDVFARTEGIRLSGATPIDRVPDEGPELLVSGTIQVASPRVRIALRLAKPSGTQIWSTHVDGLLDGDDLEPTLVRRLAESVRLQVSARAIEGAVSSAALQLYLEASKLLRVGSGHVDEVVQLLDHAQTEAPGVPVIVAKRALALVTASRWADELEGHEPDEERAHEAIVAARTLAPHCADTHIANAEWHLLEGDLQPAIGELLEALDRAPTSALAHHRLARLQMRAGRTDKATLRCEHALELEPELTEAILTQVRLAAFAGDDPGADALLARAASRLGRSHTSLLLTQIRLGLWTGREELVEDAGRWLGTTPAHRRLRSMVELTTRRRTRADALELPRRWLGGRGAFATLAAEIWLHRDEPEEAMAALRTSAEALHDLDWLQRCPANVALRERPDFMQLTAAVRAVVTASFQRHAGKRSTITL